MEKDFFEEERYLKAQKRVKAIKGFYWNLAWYLIINILWLVIIIYFDKEKSSFKYGFWNMGYGLMANVSLWGIGLFFHWFVVFGRHFTFSKRWEERKIKELMKEDNNNIKY